MFYYMHDVHASIKAWNVCQGLCLHEGNTCFKIWFEQELYNSYSNTRYVPAINNSKNPRLA